MHVGWRFILYMLPTLVSTGLALVTLPLTMLLLGPEEFGLFALPWSAVSLGTTLETEHIEQPRLGNHICHIIDLTKFKSNYPSWEITRSLDDNLAELAGMAVRTRELD